MIQASLFPELPDIRLRDYQAAARAKFLADVVPSDSPGGLIRQPTGTGKTHVACAIIQDWQKLGARRRTLVLCHERQLVDQFAETLAEVTGLPVEIDMAEQKASARAPVVVACRQSYLQRQTSAGVASRAYKFSAAHDWLLVCDEAHRFKPSLATVKHLVAHFQQNPRSKLLGLTATPERTDRVSLATLFPTVCADYLYRDALADGWVVPLVQHFVRVEGVDFADLKTVAKDFDEGDLERVLSEEKTLAGFVEPTLELVGERQTLIFSPTIAMAHRVAAYINARRGFMACYAINGATAHDARAEVYANFQRGGFQFLSVCGLCREGFNCPPVAAIACFRPTKSKPLAEQMKGRGGRPLPGVVDGLETPPERVAAIGASRKPDCLIVDLVGISGLAGARTCADIFADGLTDDVLERAARFLERGEHDPRQAVQLAEDELAAEKAEALRAAQERAERAARLDPRVRWASQVVADGHGHTQDIGQIRTGPTERQWKYLCLWGLPRSDRMSMAQASRIIGQHQRGLSTEEICRLNGMSRDTARPVAATSKQLWFMRQLGIVIPAGCTKKQAMQLIDARQKAKEQSSGVV